MNLITQTTQSFTFTLWSLFSETDSFADKLLSVRRLYEVTEIHNRVSDGTQHFPEDTASLRSGISIEFRYGVASYPLTDMSLLTSVPEMLVSGIQIVRTGLSKMSLSR